MLTATPVILTTAIIFTTFHRVGERTPEVEFPYCNSMSTKRETVQPLSRDLDPGADSGSADSLMWVINTQLCLVFLFRGAREIFFWWTQFLKLKKNYKQLRACATIQPHVHAQWPQKQLTFLLLSFLSLFSNSVVLLQQYAESLGWHRSYIAAHFNENSLYSE